MLDTLWTRLLTVLERHLPATALDRWVRPCRLGGIHGDHLRIVTPNQFTRDWLVQHHAETVQAAAREVLGGNPRVTFEVDRNAPVPAAPPGRPRSSRPIRSSPAPRPRPACPCATRSSPSWSATPTSSPRPPVRRWPIYPPRPITRLFIYGGVGLGKTHLLHAVGHQITRAYPQLLVLYISSERFTNELINAIRYDRTAEFRAKYRNIDLLLIDDIQFLSGKERTQEEFFHTFNDLYEARKQIVMSSDAAPKEIPDLEERLRSRFEWGLIADIQPPDFETRVAILRKKAEIERVRLPDDVAYLIASRIKANIREIEGSLTRMIAYCALSGRDMTVDLAQEVLADLWGEDERVITIDHIQRKVAEFFGIKLSDLRAQNRTKAIAFPRQIAMYISRQLTHASLSEVGRAFGGKDHTTVLHGVEKIQQMLQEDPKFKKTIDSITQSITL